MLTEILPPLIESSLKALALLGVASAAAVALRGMSARARAVIWGTALVGSLLIPLAGPFLPAWPLALPTLPLSSTIRPVAASAPATAFAPSLGRQVTVATADRGPAEATTMAAASSSAAHAAPDLASIMAVIWAAGVILILLWQAIGWLRVWSMVRRATAVEDSGWREALEGAIDELPAGRRVRLLRTSALATPATWGALRPVILLPDASLRWLRERRDLVLRHELVHVTRHDWALRSMARLACAAYWFNPLVWWASHRLILEQEMACDQEVVALGTRPSTYASHLLILARSPVLAASALQMAKQTQMEGRIMAILNNTRKQMRPATLAAVAILVLALAATVAAVQPTIPADSERDVTSVMRDIRAAEARWRPQLEGIESIAEEYEPTIKQLEAIEIDVDDEAMAELERQMEPLEAELEALELEMAPLQEQLEGIEAAMEPFHEEMEALHENLDLDEITLGDLDIRDDMTIAELMEQVHEAVAPLQEQVEAAHARIAPQLEALESIHVDMAPYHDRMEEIQREMEPLIERITEAHLHEIQPHLEALEKAQLDLAPMHERLAEIEKQLEPFHEEMERLGDELEAAVARDIESLLRRTLGTVVGGGAPFYEAAARIAEEASIRIDDDVLEVRADRREIRNIITDIFGPERSSGLSDLSFDSAVDDAVDAISRYEVEIPE